jgi:DNA-directed RNA polymerase specialized sigma24 family protein
VEKLLEDRAPSEISTELGVSPPTVSAEMRSIAEAIQRQCPDRAAQQEMLAAVAEIAGVSQ